MVLGFAIFSSIVIVAISGLHLYWAFGGRWGSAAAVPHTVDGGPLFVPRTAETIVVAMLLLIAAAALLVESGFVAFIDSNVYIKIVCIICAIVFFARSIGEFRYLGFFKKITNTRFARYDTRLFSPLCLFLAVSFLLVLILPSP